MRNPQIERTVTGTIFYNGQRFISDKEYAVPGMHSANLPSSTMLEDGRSVILEGEILDHPVEEWRGRDPLNIVHFNGKKYSIWRPVARYQARWTPGRRGSEDCQLTIWSMDDHSTIWDEFIEGASLGHFGATMEISVANMRQLEFFLGEECWLPPGHELWRGHEWSEWVKDLPIYKTRLSLVEQRLVSAAIRALEEVWVQNGKPPIHVDKKTGYLLMGERKYYLFHYCLKEDYMSEGLHSNLWASFNVGAKGMKQVIANMSDEELHRFFADRAKNR